jgi:hypothetical protein
LAFLNNLSDYMTVPIPDCVLIHAPRPDDIERLDAWRRDAIKDRDEFMALQKEFGAARDRETAKFFKECGAEALKVYRAICIVAGYLAGNEAGDRKLLEFKDWPRELRPHIRHLFARLAA